MNIYQIDEQILECIDIETGEIIDTDRLDNLYMERDKKIENVALWCKELKAEIDALANEIKSLTGRKTADQNKLESLKRYLDYALDGDKFKTTKVSIGYRKSESVEITNIGLLDDCYLRMKDPEPDKASIKKALKDGKEVNGANLVTELKIQIK